MNYKYLIVSVLNNWELMFIEHDIHNNWLIPACNERKQPIVIDMFVEEVIGNEYYTNAQSARKKANILQKEHDKHNKHRKLVYYVAQVPVDLPSNNKNLRKSSTHRRLIRDTRGK